MFNHSFIVTLPPPVEVSLRHIYWRWVQRWVQLTCNRSHVTMASSVLKVVAPVVELGSWRYGLIAQDWEGVPCSCTHLQKVSQMGQFTSRLTCWWTLRWVGPHVFSAGFGNVVADRIRCLDKIIIIFLSLVFKIYNKAIRYILSIHLQCGYELLYIC
jgi:hypothetical protein